MEHIKCPASWTEELPLDQTLKVLTDLALCHAAEAGANRTRLEEYLRTGDWAGITSFSIDYSVGTVDELYHTRQALSFFQKLEPLPLGVDKEQVARDAFRLSESLNSLTNARFQRSLASEIPEGVSSVLLLAQRKIDEILGDVPTLGELNIGFGPGANVGIKATASSARWKCESPMKCSADMAPILREALEELPALVFEHRTFKERELCQEFPLIFNAAWQADGSVEFHSIMLENYDLTPDQGVRVLEWYRKSYHSGGYPTEFGKAEFTMSLLARLEEHLDRVLVVVEIVPGNFSFAKKNAKTYRSIVVEPPINTLFQKGIGKFIRQKLRRAGLDLDVLASVNKTLAQAASIDGRLATVDLQMASNLIARAVIWELFSLSWSEFLSSFRTSTVRFKDGQLVPLELFSSMGNGFTFELESLIFYALAYGCTAQLRLNCAQVTSFGDDIILPVEAIPLLYKTLGYMGFLVNEEKSFIDGRFRESCGGDYVDGIDIRPFYQKRLVSGQTLFALHNYYARTLQPEKARAVQEYLHPDLIIWGPDGYGDGHLVGTWEQYARKHKTPCYSGVTFDTFTLKSAKNFNRAKKGDRVLPTYSIYTAGELDHLSYLDGADVPPIQRGKPMHADHYVVRGDDGYKRISIYTFRTDVFVRLK